MLISLSKIKPSPNPVRTQWDEDKMNELAQSIKEQGLIVPIKVRPVKEWVENCYHMQDKRWPRWPMFCAEFQQYTLEKYGQEGTNYGTEPGLCTWCEYAQLSDGDGRHKDLEEDCEIPHDWKPYEIIYGHRRVEACKRAGLTGIEAIVEGVDDNKSHTQAGIENLVREDMRPFEIAEWCQSELAKGKTQAEVGAIVGKGDTWVNQYIMLLNQPVEVRRITESSPGQIQEKHIRVTRRNIDNPNDIAPILEKTVNEGLGWRQTEQIAKAIKEAPSEQAKKKLLEWEYSPTIHNPELIKERAKTHGAHDPIYRNDKPSPQKEWDDSPQVKMIIDAFRIAIKSFLDLMREMQNLAQIGKLAPEGKQFMIHRLRSFRNDIDQMITELEDNHG